MPDRTLSELLLAGELDALIAAHPPAQYDTLEAFLGDAAEQGVTARRLAPEELFAPETLERFRV